jgi:solute carrier family 35 protein C2
VLLGSLLAFLMELSEYLLLTYTSSLTLSIAGIFKEIFTLFLAYEYTGDRMSSINFMGLVLCLIGISLHVVLKAVDATVTPESNFKDSAKHGIERKKLLEETPT